MEELAPFSMPITYAAAESFQMSFLTRMIQVERCRLGNPPTRTESFQMSGNLKTAITSA